jgi:hypothetical protein
MMTVGKDSSEKKESKERTSSSGMGDKNRSGSFQNAVNKGKEMLGLKGKVEKGGSAIEDD